MGVKVLQLVVLLSCASAAVPPGGASPLQDWSELPAEKQALLQNLFADYQRLRGVEAENLRLRGVEADNLRLRASAAAATAAAEQSRASAAAAIAAAEQSRLSQPSSWVSTRDLNITRVPPLAWGTLNHWSRPEETETMWNDRFSGVSTNFSGFQEQTSPSRPYSVSVRSRYSMNIFGKGTYQVAHLIPHNSACRYILFVVVSFLACWADPRKVAVFLTRNSIAGDEKGLMMERYNYIPIAVQAYFDNNPLVVILPILTIEEQLNFNITRNDNTYQALVIAFNDDVFASLGATSADPPLDLLDTNIPAQRHKASVALNGHVHGSRLVVSLMLERHRHPDNVDGRLTSAEMTQLVNTNITNTCQSALEEARTSGIPVFDPAAIPDNAHFRVVTFTGPYIPHPFLLHVKNVNALANLDDAVRTGTTESKQVLFRHPQKVFPGCRDLDTAELCGFCYDQLVCEGLAEPVDSEEAGE